MFRAVFLAVRRIFAFWRKILDEFEAAWKDKTRKIKAI